MTKKMSDFDKFVKSVNKSIMLSCECPMTKCCECKLGLPNNKCLGIEYRNVVRELFLEKPGCLI